MVRLLLLVLVPMLAVLAGLYLYARGGREVETENAYVKQNVIAVSAEVSGKVAEVAVRDDQPVTAGAVLFRIDPTPFEIAVARARRADGRGAHRRAVAACRVSRDAARRIVARRSASNS